MNLLNRKLQTLKKTAHSQQGFTLIEVMVVLLIIDIMASMIAPQILGSQEEAQLKKAAVDIQSLESALEMYKLKNNTFPTTEQGLDALVTAPTIILSRAIIRKVGLSNVYLTIPGVTPTN